jgi:hypothetical protein
METAPIYCQTMIARQARQLGSNGQRIGLPVAIGGSDI